jgi:hypothetical protein
VPEHIDHVPQVELANFLHLLALLIRSGSTGQRTSQVNAATQRNATQHNTTQHVNVAIPVFLADKQVEGILSSEERIVIQYFHRCHPVWVVVPCYLPTL